MGKPYELGFNAYGEGHGLEENPYHIGTIEYVKWGQGWQDHEERGCCTEAVAELRQKQPRI